MGTWLNESVSTGLVQRPYVVPSLLRDLVLLDMVELAGSTVAAAKLLNVSQPTVSRRFRAVCNDLQITGNLKERAGQRLEHNPCLRLLRRGICHHRWDAASLRFGIEAGLPFPSGGRVQWVGLRVDQPSDWDCLMRAELIDGALVKGEDQAALSNCGDTWITPKGWGDGILVSRRHPKVRKLVEGLMSATIADQRSSTSD